MTPHLTPELVKGYRRGRISYEELLDLVFGHVGAVCSHCRGGYEALESPASFWDPALLCKTVSRLALEHHIEVQRSIEGAQADIRSLKGLPPDLRRQRIERAYRRFRGEDLVELLVAEAQRYLHKDPRESLHWAELAWAAAWSTPHCSTESLALTCAELANSQRAAGELKRAEKTFDHVYHLVERHRVNSLSVLARIKVIEGSLCRDFGRTEAATRALEQAMMLFRVLEDSRGLARAGVTLADTFFYGGMVDKALVCVQKVLETVSAAAEPELSLWARHNLTCYLVEAGRFAEAALEREAGEPLYRQYFFGSSLLRLLWMDGRILAGRGEISGAVAAFEEAREGFLGGGFQLGAILVAADLAALHAREGHFREFRVMARVVTEGEREYPLQDCPVLRPAMTLLERHGYRSHRQVTVEKPRTAASLP